MSGRKHLLLGVFVVVVIALLGYFTVFLREFSFFKDRPHLTVYFENARGLRVGDAVLVAGVRWGRIEGIVYHPEAERDKRITIDLRLDEPIDLREGAEIRIEDATVLGGRQVTIDPGPQASPMLDTNKPLFGEIAASPLDAVGDFVRNNNENVTQTLADLRELVAGVRAGRGVVGGLLVDENMRTEFAETITSARTSAANIATISDNLVAGRGTIGKLLAEEQIYAQLSEIGDSLAALTADARAVVAAAREGDGLVSMLLNDAAIATDAAETMKSVRAIVDSINRGEGTLGALVREDGIARRAEELLTSLSSGGGTFGKLLNDDALYEGLRSVSSDLATVMAKVRSGEGTIGKLFMEEALYADLARAVQLVNRSLEEYREAAPISTMTSVLFGAF